MKKQKKLPRASVTVRLEPSLIMTLDSNRTATVTRTRLIEDAVKLYLAAEFPENFQQKSA